jgi:hypothetical protein
MIFGILAVSHLNSYIIAAISGFIGACVATFGTWFLDWRRRVTERKQVAEAVMAELEAVLQIVQIRQYQNILANLIDSMTKTGKAANPRIPIRENFMPIYTAHIGKLGFLQHPVPSNLALLYTFALAIKEDFRTLWEMPDTVDVQFLIQFEKNMLLLLNLTVALGEETLADLRVFLRQRLGPHLRQKHDEAMKRRKEYQKELEERERQIRESGQTRTPK